MGFYKTERKKYLNMVNVANELEMQRKKDNEMIDNMSAVIDFMRKQSNLNQVHFKEIDQIDKMIADRTDNEKKIQKLKIKDIDKLNPDKIEEAINALKIPNKNLDGARESKSQEKNERRLQSKVEYNLLPVEGKGKKMETYYDKHEYTRILGWGIAKKINHEKRCMHATALMLKLRKEDINKVSQIIPLKSILKQITQFFNEKISVSRENPMLLDQDMGVFVYKLFINTYGFKKFAEKKFYKFCLSIKKYLNINRVSKFARVMGIYDTNINYSSDEARLYITSLAFMQSASLGTNVDNHDYDKKIYAPYARASELLKNFLEKRISQEEYFEIKKDFDKLKESDPLGVNKGGIIEIESFLEKFLIRSKLLLRSSKEVLLAAFLGGDLEANGKLHYVEFAMLFKYIESDRYETKKSEELFINYADLIEGDEVWMSQEKFIGVAFEKELFLLARQNKIIGVNNNDDLNKKCNELASRWAKQKQSIQFAFNQLQNQMDEIVYKMLYQGFQWLDFHLYQEKNALKMRIILIKFAIICGELSVE